MNKVIEWKDIVEEIEGNKIRKRNIKLLIDCIYKNKTYAQNYAGDVFTILMPGVGLSGGFRFCGKISNKSIKYVVLFSTNKDIYWQDQLDEELGLYIYYGDNQTPGKELHEPNGNKILKYVFDMLSSNDFEERKKIPPFFLFERNKVGGIKFGGLLVPGYKGINQKDWLTAIWAKRNEGGRFQNYKAMFTILDTSSGSQDNPNDASIDLRWIDDLREGKGYESKYAPKAWKDWISKGIYKPLKVKIDSKVRNKNEQLPNIKEEIQMLQYIHDYFQDKPSNFESFAIELTLLTDSNIVSCDNTQLTRDGGRDGIGEYKIMSRLTNPIKTTFAIEAKCYDINHGVGVKETSRLISRIRHRQFGVFVTTSFIDKQAYKEIIEDQHPIAIISGIDIIKILFQNQITNINKLEEYLEQYFPKN